MRPSQRRHKDSLDLTKRLCLSVCLSPLSRVRLDRCRAELAFQNATLFFPWKIPTKSQLLTSSQKREREREREREVPRTCRSRAVRSVRHRPTPKMSTYLLAFVVGEFDHVSEMTKNGVLIRAFTHAWPRQNPPPTISTGSFARSLSLSLGRFCLS